MENMDSAQEIRVAMSNVTNMTIMTSDKLIRNIPSFAFSSLLVVLYIFEFKF